MNENIKDLVVKVIDRKKAKMVVTKMHYMKTFPAGSIIHFGLVSKKTKKIEGVAIFGYSSSTDAKVSQIVTNLKKSQYLEMQRLWISDKYGHNAESYCLGMLMKALKEKSDVQVVFTHAGGCKNDCGIVYQASSWLYFGKDKCTDFYLTNAGEYKNIVAAMRFGRVNSKGKTNQQVAEELFGQGKIIDSWRYKYIYPINKGIRRRLLKISLQYPKDSDNFRRNQEWVAK
jgi:hypothetical protein